MSKIESLVNTAEKNNIRLGDFGFSKLIND